MLKGSEYTKTREVYSALQSIYSYFKLCTPDTVHPNIVRSYMWTIIIVIFWYADWFKHFFGPHICRNLNHGWMGWLQEARTIAPKSSGLICTSYIPHTTQTHMVSFASSFFFFWSLSSSFLFFNKCHTHTHYFLSHFCCAEQLHCNQRGL